MLEYLYHIGRSLIRLLAFASKEAGEVARQPRLVLSLLLGPSLILLLFGVGYRSSQPTIDALLVVPANPPEGYDVAAIEQAVAGTFNLIAVVHDREAALARLRAGEVEVVEVWPDNFDALSEQGQRIPVEFYTNEFNPFNEQWIQYLGYGQINQVNDLILTRAAAANQGDVASSAEVLGQVRAEVAALRLGTAAASEPGAIERLERLVAALVLSATFSDEVAPETLTDLQLLQEDLRILREARDQGTLAEQQERLGQTEERLTRLEAAAGTLSAIPPDVLVSPLEQRYQNLNSRPADPLAYYAPSVLALLLQHIAVTLGALALVRERMMGSLELFRVAPISAFQMLAGKYLGYLLFIGVMAATLVALMIFGLRVPFQGDPLRFALVTALLIIAALGLGFTFSAISTTDSQAVQFSMLMLLLSIFFSGFFIPLDSFAPWMQPLSYSLPLTHGIAAFQQEMLLGRLQDPFTPLWLALIAAVTFMTAMIFTRRLFRRV